MAEDARTILSYLKDPNSRYGAHTWQSVNGEVKVQWLPDEGRGWIDIENPKGVKGASGFRKLMRSTLPKLDVISEIPAKWEWNPDDIKKGGIYEYLGPKMKGSFKANPNMPNKASVWDTRPKSKGTIMGVKKTAPKPNIDSLRISLGDKLEELRIKKGINITEVNKPLLSGLRSAVEKEIPEGYRIESLNQFFKDKQKNPNAKLKIKPKKTGGGIKPREVYEDVPGQITNNPSKNMARFLRRKGRTAEFIETLSDLGYDDAQIEKYMYEVGQGNLKLRNLVQRMNTKLPPGQKVSVGHLQPVSKSINSPFNRFLELLDPNVAKGDNYSLTPAGQTAIGNPVKPGADWLENWKRDFLTWADKSENGGDGILPQRGTFSSLQEQKFSEFTGMDYDKLSPENKLKATNQVNDLLGEFEELNQWSASQGKQLKKWGYLSKLQAEQFKDWSNDNELLKGVDDPVIEKGRRFGGIGHNISKATKAATGLSRAESIVRIAGGDVIGGTAGLAMTTPAFQKQMGKLLLKRGITMIPGVSFGSGALQAVGYASGGQWTKAGLSALGGVIGEFGPAGDAVQAAIDLGLTGHDVKLGDINRGYSLEGELEDAGTLRRGARSIARSIP